jgi:hypothetical protein
LAGACRKGGYTGVAVNTPSPGWPTARTATLKPVTTPGSHTSQSGSMRQPWSRAMPSMHGLEHRRPRVGVAEHPVVDARLEGFEHRRGRGEVHVGHPHRDHVAAGVAAPLDAVGAGAVGAVLKSKGSNQTSRCWKSTVDR